MLPTFTSIGVIIQKLVPSVHTDTGTGYGFSGLAAVSMLKHLRKAGEYERAMTTPVFAGSGSIGVPEFKVGFWNAHASTVAHSFIGPSSMASSRGFPPTRFILCFTNIVNRHILLSCAKQSLPILSAAGSCKIEHPERSRGTILR
jgi:hypothetical protein